MLLGAKAGKDVGGPLGSERAGSSAAYNQHLTSKPAGDRLGLGLGTIQVGMGSPSSVCTPPAQGGDAVPPAAAALGALPGLLLAVAGAASVLKLQCCHAAFCAMAQRYRETGVKQGRRGGPRQQQWRRRRQ